VARLGEAQRAVTGGDCPRRCCTDAHVLRKEKPPALGSTGAKGWEVNSDRENGATLRDALLRATSMEPFYAIFLVRRSPDA
jgi:hypothetical protein